MEAALRTPSTTPLRTASDCVAVSVTRTSAYDAPAASAASRHSWQYVFTNGSLVLVGATCAPA
jgi:hypothetical protein